METVEVRTESREEMVDVTSRVRETIRERGWKGGAVVLYCPHTTAALTVNEGADPDVCRDVVAHLRRLVPRQGDWRHVEGNSDAHLKTALVGPSLTLIVEGGQLMLGTWQKIFFCEYDGPRRRSFWVRWLPGE